MVAHFPRRILGLIKQYALCFYTSQRADLVQTKTPAVLYTQDMFYMAANISQMLNVKWFMGIPFNDSVNWRLEIAENAQAIIGDNLLGLQAANEPDFYEKFVRFPYSRWPID